MPHIHTEPGQHDHVVTAYIIRTDLKEPKALLHLHRKVHKLLAIGGHVELDETPWQAIAHELREESGYDIADLTILQPHDRLAHLGDALLHPQPAAVNTHSYTDTAHFHTDTAYAFVAAGPPALAPDDGESTDLRWYARGELDTLTDSESIALPIEIYKHIFDVYLTEWERVPTDQFQNTHA